MTQNSSPKVALITGVTGQDGAYLSEFLLEGLPGAWHQATDLAVQHRAASTT
jgi:GDP-D-mannose dehydratase